MGICNYSIRFLDVVRWFQHWWMLQRRIGDISCSFVSLANSRHVMAYRLATHPDNQDHKSQILKGPHAFPVPHSILRQLTPITFIDEFEVKLQNQDPLA